MDFYLSHLVFNWLSRRGWIGNLTLGLEHIWNHNLLMFIKIQNSNRKDLLDLLLFKYDLVAFSDGAWLKSNNNVCMAGMGGIICN